MRLRRRHEHRWLPMGAVSFTAYHDYGRGGGTHTSQEPSLIYACKCGDWRWQRLYQRSEKMSFGVPT